MVIALEGVPLALTSSIPPMMLPLPSAMKTPVRARGTGVPDPAVKTSPLVTKAYWPFRLAILYLPTGGGGWTLEPPPQAPDNRAAAAAKAKCRRFIAHLVTLAFAPGSRWKRR